MNEEIKTYLSQSKNWIEETNNCNKQLNLQLSIDLALIELKKESILLSNRRIALNNKSLSDFKKQLEDYCKKEGVDLPGWAK